MDKNVKDAIAKNNLQKYLWYPVRKELKLICPYCPASQE